MPVISQPQDRPERRIDVGGVQVDLVEMGHGRPLLFLHTVDGVHPNGDFLAGLARDFSVLAPWHPGFGHSDLPPSIRSMDDLATFYLEFIEQHSLRDAILVGTSFGGWLAAEIAVRSTHAFGHLVLIDPLGIKIGDRETRDIADMHAMSQEQLTAAAYHDPSRRQRDYSTMDDWRLYAIARSREAYTYFGWRPYMHSPTLRHWLRRIRIPTLVLWGASDGIVNTAYGQEYARAIPTAEFVVVERAGHYPHLEQPATVVDHIRQFVTRTK